MNISKQLMAEKAGVERLLADDIICSRCGASLNSYAQKCSAALSDPCPGFLRIEWARGIVRSGAIYKRESKERDGDL